MNKETNFRTYLKSTLKGMSNKWLEEYKAVEEPVVIGSKKIAYRLKEWLLNNPDILPNYETSTSPVTKLSNKYNNMIFSSHLNDDLRETIIVSMEITINPIDQHKACFNKDVENEFRFNVEKFIRDMKEFNKVTYDICQVDKTQINEYRSRESILTRALKKELGVDIDGLECHFINLNTDPTHIKIEFDMLLKLVCDKEDE